MHFYFFFFASSLDVQNVSCMSRDDRIIFSFSSIPLEKETFASYANARRNRNGNGLRIDGVDSEAFHSFIPERRKLPSICERGETERERKRETGLHIVSWW